MNFKKFLFMGAALATMPFFAACSDEEDEVIDPDPETPTL